MAFAGSLLSAQQTALSENKLETSDSVIRQITDETQITPEARAFYLLNLASCYLNGMSRAAVEAQFASGLQEPNPRRSGLSSKWETILGSWANDISTKRFYPYVPEKNLALANEAIQDALIQVDKGSDNYAKLNVYFLASLFFEKSGNINGAKQCVKVLEKGFRSCEERSPVDEQEVKACASILNTMAFRRIPLLIPDHSYDLPKHVLDFTQEDFDASVKLKLRASAMVDRLPATNHQRRKAHRDLALWYLQLGKPNLADKEKEILFDLVGSKDDSILYPQQQGCGHFVWWEKPGTVFGYECGMG